MVRRTRPASLQAGGSGGIGGDSRGWSAGPKRRSGGGERLPMVDGHRRPMRRRAHVRHSTRAQVGWLDHRGRRHCGRRQGRHASARVAVGHWLRMQGLRMQGLRMQGLRRRRSTHGHRRWGSSYRHRPWHRCTVRWWFVWRSGARGGGGGWGSIASRGKGGGGVGVFIPLAVLAVALVVIHSGHLEICCDLHGLLHSRVRHCIHRRRHGVLSRVLCGRRAGPRSRRGGGRTQPLAHLTCTVEHRRGGRRCARDGALAGEVLGQRRRRNNFIRRLRTQPAHARRERRGGQFRRLHLQKLRLCERSRRARRVC